MLNEKIGKFVDAIYNIGQVDETDRCNGQDKKQNHIFAVCIEKSTNSDGKNESSVEDVFELIQKICTNTLVRDSSIYNTDNDVFKIIITNEYMFQDKGKVMDYGDDSDMSEGYEYQNNIINDATGQNSVQHKDTVSFILGRLKTISNNKNVLIIPNFLYKRSVRITQGEQDEIDEHVARMIAYSYCNPVNHFKKADNLSQVNLLQILDIISKTLNKQCSNNFGKNATASKCLKNKMNFKNQNIGNIQGCVSNIFKDNTRLDSKIRLVTQDINQKIIDDKLSLKGQSIHLATFDDCGYVQMLESMMNKLCLNERNKIENKSFYIYNGDIIATYNKSTYFSECDRNINNGDIYIFGDYSIKNCVLANSENNKQTAMQIVIQKYMLHSICRDVVYSKYFFKKDDCKVMHIVQSNSINMLNSTNYCICSAINTQSDPLKNVANIDKIQGNLRLNVDVSDCVQCQNESRSSEQCATSIHTKTIRAYDDTHVKLILDNVYAEYSDICYNYCVRYVRIE